MKLLAVKLDLTGQLYPLFEFESRDEKFTFIKKEGKDKNPGVQRTKRIMCIRFSLLFSFSIWFQRILRT